MTFISPHDSLIQHALLVSETDSIRRTKITNNEPQKDRRQLWMRCVFDNPLVWYGVCECVSGGCLVMV